MRLILALWLAVLALVSGPALAITFPPAPAGPVLDQADLLPPAREAALDASLRAYSQRTGRAVVVATVDTLEGETIEMYAVRLFEAWGIGGKESDSGLLLLIAPNERKLRVEVGYGLHPYITDAFSGRVIRHTITPKFKAGDMPGGIEAGVLALTTQMDRTPADAKAVAEAAEAAERAETGQGQSSVPSMVFWLLLFSVLWGLFGRRRRGYQRSGIDAGVGIWVASEIARGITRGGGSDFGGAGGFGGGGFGGFGGGGSGGGGASGSW